MGKIIYFICVYIICNVYFSPKDVKEIIWLVLFYHIKVINSVDISLSNPGLALSLRYCGIKVNKAAATPDCFKRDATLISLWTLILRQHPSLVAIDSTIPVYQYAPLGKSVHLWIILWPFQLLLLLSRCVLIMLIPYCNCSVVHKSMRLVFNAYSRHSLESWRSSPLVLHSHPLNFLNNFNGFPSNGESDVSLHP